MRLLFTYFYKEYAGFKKDAVVHFSNKYKFSIDNDNSKEKEFYFKKEENLDFIEDFYSINSDICLIVGQNGTGKSLLINSLRDKDNNYSVCVYEENNELYILENDLFELKLSKESLRNGVPYENKHIDDFSLIIDGIVVKRKRRFKSIYYSSLLENTYKSFNDDFDVSNSKLFSESDGQTFNSKLSRLESNDILKSQSLNYDIKPELSEFFFEDSKNYLKNNYLNFFDETVKVCKNKNRNREIEEIFNKLPEFIINDIIKYNLEKNNIFIKVIQQNKNLVNEYINEYEKDFDSFFKNSEIKKEELLFDMDKQIEDGIHNLFSEDFFNKLEKISFDINRNNILNILDEIRKLFDIKYTSYSSNNPKEYEKRIIKYLYKNKLFDKCLDLLAYKGTNIELQKTFFNLYRIYYLRQELGYKNYIVIDFFKKGYFKDIILFDKKLVHYNISKDNEELIYYKENTVIEIKKIIEKNYKLFYDIIFTNLDSISDVTLKLIIIKHLESINLEEFSEKCNLKAIYVYISKLIKSVNIENDERIHLIKIIKKKDDFIFELLVLFNKYCTNKGDLLKDNSFNFKKYKKFIKNTVSPFSFKFNPPISSGQKERVVFYARIYDVIEQINDVQENDSILILLDEVDLKLHLEWQRTFIYDLIEFLNSFTNNKIFLLYATHSPIVLSDITNDRIIFLRKLDNSYTTIKNYLIVNNKQRPSFGANIYDIYSDSFFVDEFMGKFAQTKIQKLIEKIKKYKSEDKKLSNQETFDLLKISNHIGEPLLRNKLTDDIKSLTEEKNEIDIVIERLKEKSFDEIKEQLSKYSISMQKVILEKLLESSYDKS